MTAELDDDMTHGGKGKDTQDHVVDHSRALLAGMLDTSSSIRTTWARPSPTP